MNDRLTHVDANTSERETLVTMDVEVSSPWQVCEATGGEQHGLTPHCRRHTIRPMAVQAPAIGALLGHYRLLEQIGKGGMGVVFRATDEQLARDVAVKILPPGTFPDEHARKRFLREARLLAKLNHPNVAMAFDFGQQDDVDFLVTEFVPGITLDAKLANGPLPQTTVLELGVQLTKGLEVAHRQAIIHRDLKPGNLRLTAAGELKILDFGLAYLRQPVLEMAETLTLETHDRGAGTLPYMAPEQIRCEELDARTDIWGAGAVLYEMATGKQPFCSASGLKLIRDIQNLDPPDPSTLNGQIAPALDAIILKALDKDRDRRYQSARELGIDLLKLLPITTSLGKPISSGFAPARKSRTLATWLAVCFVTVVLTYGGYLFRVKGTHWRSSKHTLLTVLPFDSTGQDDKTSALVMGLTETLTAKLAQPWGNDLQLISARDVRAQGVRTPDQAWKEFGTDLVLEGSAHRFGDQIRINCALVDPKTHRQVTARTITADTNDVFGLEDQVVSEVISLVSDDAGIPADVRRTARNESKPEAYAAYLRARGYLLDYQKAENIELAIAELKNALALDPGYANAYAALGDAYLRGYQQVNRGAEWVNQAKQNCLTSLTVHETADGRICLGGVYNATGKYDLGVQEFQRAAQIDPTNEDGLRGTADAYVRLGNQAAAEAAYQKAVSLRPKYWGVYSWLGTFYYTQARYSEAITQFQKVVELAPANYRGYSNLGGMYVAQGRYTESLGPLSKSIEIRPNLEAFNNLGNAYYELRRFADAADAFQHGLNLDDSDWLLWGNLGDSLYWNGGQRSKAMVAYENAIKRAAQRLAVNPKDATTLAYSADYNAMSGHRAEAIQEIERALALAPTDGEVRFRAAIAYNQLGDANLCLASLEKAVGLGYSMQVIWDTPDFDHLHNHPRLRALTHHSQPTVV
jgi:serine/threonine protein kinase/tetratricopeptide (TPR) repeat protein